MHVANTLFQPDPALLPPLLDDVAAYEYRCGRAGRPGPAVTGQPTVYGELWLMAVARQTSDPGQWVVYAITSEEDVPGWPYDTGQYTGGLRSGADWARPLAAAGHQVVLRHYADFGVTSTAADVPLT
ncbi:hypothetical protein [Kitasatospora sp. CB02891]|uniref:hypothetical protein n=1 Tax=Kitasatospora sp. CB02891 TaxID=2020329 RepID=UPI000C27401D|nr:hypothetical protein [Kitasatospora sp. CB02891]PJN24071.1 hypothetical protein CG736_19440 [Kitasatospora sp. CB02891]